MLIKIRRLIKATSLFSSTEILTSKSLKILIMPIKKMFIKKKNNNRWIVLLKLSGLFDFSTKNQLIITD